MGRHSLHYAVIDIIMMFLICFCAFAQSTEVKVVAFYFHELRYGSTIFLREFCKEVV